MSEEEVDEPKPTKLAWFSLALLAVLTCLCFVGCRNRTVYVQPAQQVVEQEPVVVQQAPVMVAPVDPYYGSGVHLHIHTGYPSYRRPVIHNTTIINNYRGRR
jgi:hypothetical protein